MKRLIYVNAGLAAKMRIMIAKIAGSSPSKADHRIHRDLATGEVLREVAVPLGQTPPVPKETTHPNGAEHTFDEFTQKRRKMQKRSKVRGRRREVVQDQLDSIFAKRTTNLASNAHGRVSRTQ